MSLDVLAGFFTHHKQSDMGPIEDYIKENSRMFASEEDAKIAAFVAHLAGSPGSRTTFLMAAMEELTPLSSASSKARVEGRKD